MGRRFQTYGAFNRFTDPEEGLASARQEFVDRLNGIMSSAANAAHFPAVFVEAVKKEVWLHPRRLGPGDIIPQMSWKEFLATPYPNGLGTTEEVIKKLCRGDPAALGAFDEATTKKPGGNKNPAGTNQHTKPKADEVKLYNIQDDLSRAESAAPTGTTAQAGLRRLRKAAAKGDTKAADLLRQVLEHSMTIHASNVAMGWRKHTLTVVDTPEGVSRAAVGKIGPLGVVQFAWQMATPAERVQITEWINEQTSRRKGA